MRIIGKPRKEREKERKVNWERWKTKEDDAIKIQSHENRIFKTLFSLKTNKPIKIAPDYI